MIMADTTQIIELTIDLDKAVADTAKYQREVNFLKANLDQLSKSQDATYEEVVKANAAYQAARGQLASHQKVVKSLTEQQDEEAGTLEKLRARNAQLRIERDKLNLTTDEGRQRVSEINAELDRNNEIIKENSDKQKQQTLNVGNYKEDIEAAAQSTGVFSGALQGNTSSLLDMANTEGGVKGLFGSLVSGLGAATKAGLTFIATPIGAVITAIVLGIGLITKAISGNQNAADSWGKAWGGVTEVLSFLGGLLTKMGVWLIDLGKSIKSPKEALMDFADFIWNNLVNRIKAFGVIADGIGKLMSGDWSDAAKTLTDGFGQLATGVENITDKMAGLGTEMGEAYKRGMELKQMQIDLEKTQIANITTLQKLQNEQTRLSAIADDATRSLKEQEAANKQLNEVNKKLADESVAVAEKELAIQKKITENMMANNGSVTREQEKSLAEATANLLAAESERTAIIAEASKKQREIRKDALNRELDFLIDGFDSIKTYNEKIITNEKETVDKRVKMQDDLKNAATANFEKQIEAVEKYYKIRIDGDALLAENDAKALNETVANFNLADDISGRILEIIKERRMQLSDFAETDTALTEAQAQAAIEAMNKELAAFLKNNQTKIEENGKLSADLVAEEEARLALIMQKQNETAQAQYDKGLITAQQLADQKILIEEENQTQISELRTAWSEQQMADQLTAKQMQYDAEMELAEGNLFAQLDLEKKAMDKRKAYEMALIDELAINEEEKNTLKLKNAEKFTKAEIAIEKAKTNAKLSLASDFAGNIATIAGEGTEIGKAAAVAQTTISTYQAATGAYASLAAIPVVGPVLGIAAAGAAVAAGLANVKQILSVNTDVSSGATSTPSASTSTASAAPTLSLPTASSPTIGQGIVSRESTDNSASIIKQGFAEALQENPIQPTLVIDDVTAAQNTSAQNQRSATI